MSRIAELQETRQRLQAAADNIRAQARAANRELTTRESSVLAESDAALLVLDRKISDETKAAFNGQSRGRYTADVEGREGELLRPDQAMSAWLERRKGRQLAHDVDWNAYWAQRMGIAKTGAELRALGEDTSSGNGAGQAIVPQEWSTSFVDILRPQLVIGRAGATIMPMESEVFNLPQYVSDVSPQWLAENTTLSLDANPQFSTVQFNATGAFTDVTLLSRQVAEDTNQAGGLSQLLQETIGAKYQRVIDQVAFYGATGSAGNPGLVNETGLVVQSMGTNGAAPTDTTYVSVAAEAVRNANAEPSAVVTNPKVYGTTSRLNASTYAKFWDLPDDVASIPWLYSTALASNEAQGTGTNLSSLYMGDWSRMIIGMRVDLDVTVLRERYADSNQIGLLSYMRFSIRTTHPESFVRVKGIVTT